jgi:hypothetical protein
VLPKKLLQVDYLKNGNFPMAVLLEGLLRSMFENRVSPFDQQTYKNSGTYKQNDRNC